MLSWIAKHFKVVRVHPLDPEFQKAVQEIEAALKWQCYRIETDSCLGKVYFSGKEFTVELIYDVPASEVEIRVTVELDSPAKFWITRSAIVLSSEDENVRSFSRKQKVRTGGDGKQWLVDESVAIFRSLEKALSDDGVVLSDKKLVSDWLYSRSSQ